MLFAFMAVMTDAKRNSSFSTGPKIKPSLTTRVGQQSIEKLNLVRSKTSDRNFIQPQSKENLRKFSQNNYRKPVVGKEVISLAEKWLENCNIDPKRSNSLKTSRIPDREDLVSRDIKVYIPLEKTYRAELRQITERIGLKLTENDSSKAAKDYVLQNPNEADKIISQEKQTIQSFSLSSNTSELSRVMTSQGPRKLSSFRTANNVETRAELTNRPKTASKNGNNNYQKQSPGQNIASSIPSTGIRVDNNNNSESVTKRSQSFQSTAAQKRTPTATKTVPSNILEEPLKILRRETTVGGVLNRRNSHVSIGATTANFEKSSRHKFPVDRNMLARRTSIQYFAMPGYDARYHLQPDRPWINDLETCSGYGDPDDEIILHQDNPTQESINQSVKKCFDWLDKCPSPSSLGWMHAVKNLTEVN